MDKEKFYKEYFKITSPYKHQLKVWETIEKFNFPILLRAPTGSGKTEAVLAPFLAQFVENKFSIAPRLIYVLPMRVLVNSIANRIEENAKSVSPNISVSAQHGDLPDSPFFMSDIVITTLDQFLYAFARTSKQVGRHIDVPAGAIASSIVVFDEAHMYRDEFTFSVMRAIMEILYHSGIPFVVMTATMPESLQNSLFENIGIDNGQTVTGDLPFKSTLYWKIEKEPLVYENGEVNINESLLSLMKKRKTLIVVNQVKRAKKVYEEVKKRLSLEKDRIVLLHSRFTRQHRKEHEAKALSLMPHKENGQLIIPEGTAVVVSTQVLEAGVDFSAELLLTELAPADSIVQRAGRCARYKGQVGEVVIFPVEGDRAHLPYEKKHMENTLNWLKSNPDFNIKDFGQVCQFVNETLDYRANDFEAVDTLIDLYECVLYADEKPENIQVRKDKSAKVVVVEPKIGERKIETKEAQLENGIKEILRNGRLGDCSFEVDIKVLWSWFKHGLFRYEMRWEENEKGRIQPKVVALRSSDREPVAEDPRISPFRTYILESSNYDSEKGVKGDEAEFI